MQVPFATVVDIRIDKDPLVAGCLDGSIRQHIVTVSTAGRKEVQERVWAFGLIFLDLIFCKNRSAKTSHTDKMQMLTWLTWNGSMWFLFCFWSVTWPRTKRSRHEQQQKLSQKSKSWVAQS